MNLNQGFELFVTLSASFEHDAVLFWPSSDADVFVHKKKFLDPNAISFSSLPKPAIKRTQKYRQSITAVRFPKNIET